MTIAPDTRLHLIGGTLFAVVTLAIILWGKHLGIGSAIIVAAVVFGWAVERYQAIRHEGLPDRKDWIATSVPGVLFGAAVQLAEWWFR